MYLLVCSYSLDWKTEKCLEMGWNCQNTLGSSVSYRILRESKCFTLSRFEKWVSWELVCSFMRSEFRITYWFVRILWIGKPKNVSKWVEIVKIPFQVRTGLFVFSGGKPKNVSYRILRESKCFTLSRFEKWVSWELVCSYSLHSKTGKCLQMGWNCQNTLGSSVSYRILRESKCFTLSRVLIG